MKNSRKITLQKSEIDFIESVVNCILKKDLSREHYLIDEKGIMRYKSYLVDKLPIHDLHYENGNRVKIVCVFGKELIEAVHSKAGNDDLSKPWIRRAVQRIIAHGKEVAAEIYN